MKKVSWLIVGLVGVLLVGGSAFLVMWDIPAPVTTVEKEIPDDRFPR